VTRFLADLAERYGTPLYVYDLEHLDAAHRSLTADLPTPHTLFYSLKANPLPALARRLARLGCHAEVSSRGELDVATEAGFGPDRVLYTGPAKRPADVEAAIATGCRAFSLESGHDARLVHTAAARADVTVRGLIRLNVDESLSGVGMAFGGTASAFGTDLSRVLAGLDAYRFADHLRVDGVHLYLAGNVHDENALTQTLVTAAEAAQSVVKAGLPLAVVDLGGGFGAPYARPGAHLRYPGLSRSLADALDRTLDGWRTGRPALWFESGRYLAGPAGTLVVRVADVKESLGRRFVVVDSGIHHLGGMAGLGRLPMFQVEPVTAGPAGPVRDTRVVGELCTPLDRWAIQAALPVSLRPGDLLTVPNVGAYGLTASLLGFLSHPAPLEVVVDGGAVVEAGRIELRRSPLRTEPDRIDAEDDDAHRH
jgi:diaminopimelate decarboxylase